MAVQYSDAPIILHLVVDEELCQVLEVVTRYGSCLVIDEWKTVISRRVNELILHRLKNLGLERDVKGVWSSA